MTKTNILIITLGIFFALAYVIPKTDQQQIMAEEDIDEKEFFSGLYMKDT